MNIASVGAQLNNFACRAFRDVADHDYIAARLCYRAGLISQFQWSAQQAFEKYYKGILLFNRIIARDVGHDLLLAKKYADRAPFKIRLSETSVSFIKHLNTYGRFRYLEVPYQTYGPKLMELDKAVWELRRYCRVMDYAIARSGGSPLNMLDLEVQRNEEAEARPRQEFRIVGGALEAIVSNESSPARTALVWQNAYFGSSRRTTVTIPVHSYSENSPLIEKPELLKHVLRYVFIPKAVVEAYRREIN